MCIYRNPTKQKSEYKIALDTLKPEVGEYKRWKKQQQEFSLMPLLCYWWWWWMHNGWIQVWCKMEIMLERGAHTSHTHIHTNKLLFLEQRCIQAREEIHGTLLLRKKNAQTYTSVQILYTCMHNDMVMMMEQKTTQERKGNKNFCGGKKREARKIYDHGDPWW